MSESADPDAIITEISDSIATIIFNSPSQRNCLSTSTLKLFDQILTDVTSRSDIDSIIFTGLGNFFLSGADIQELLALTANDARDFSSVGQGLFQRISTARQASIAAINGFCMGGGLDLALACDVRLAAASAVFAHPGSRLGIITGWGGTQRLPRIVGRSKAIELLATGRRFTSQEALRMGLVTGIHDPVLQAAKGLAKGIRANHG